MASNRIANINFFIYRLQRDFFYFFTNKYFPELTVLYMRSARVLNYLITIFCK
jgi:hypothetical protein